MTADFVSFFLLAPDGRSYALGTLLLLAPDGKNTAAGEKEAIPDNFSPAAFSRELSHERESAARVIAPREKCPVAITLSCGTSVGCKFDVGVGGVVASRDVGRLD